MSQFSLWHCLEEVGFLRLLPLVLCLSSQCARLSKRRILFQNSVSFRNESRSCGKPDRFRRVQACPTKLVPSREPLLSWRSFLTELPLKDEKKGGHKKLRSWWLFLAWQGQTFGRRCIKRKYNLKTWWHTFLSHFRLHKRIWMRINLRIGWYFLHNIVKTQDWDFTLLWIFHRVRRSWNLGVTAWTRATFKRLRISWKNTYKDYMYVQSEDKGLIVFCSCSYPMTVFFKYYSCIILLSERAKVFTEVLHFYNSEAKRLLLMVLAVRPIGPWFLKRCMNKA